jgi:hypothetical protein
MYEHFILCSLLFCVNRLKIKSRIVIYDHKTKMKVICDLHQVSNDDVII